MSPRTLCLVIALMAPVPALAAPVVEAQGEFDFLDIFDSAEIDLLDPSSDFSGTFMGDAFGVTVGAPGPTASLSGSGVQSSTLLRVEDDPADGTGGFTTDGGVTFGAPFALVFGDLTGPRSKEFGPAARVLFSFSDTGERVFEDGSGFTIPATATLAPIPVPASLPLLAAALGVAALIGRRRA